MNEKPPIPMAYANELDFICPDCLPDDAEDLDQYEKFYSVEGIIEYSNSMSSAKGKVVDVSEDVRCVCAQCKKELTK